MYKSYNIYYLMIGYIYCYNYYIEDVIYKQKVKFNDTPIIDNFKNEIYNDIQPLFAIIETINKISYFYGYLLAYEFKIIKIINKQQLINECKDYYNVLTGEYYCKDGHIHRDNDLVARINTFNDRNISQCWYNNGLLHRDNDKPAIIYIDGRKEWYQNGKLDRKNDQPAQIDSNNIQYWYKNGKLERDNDLPPII